MRGSSRNAVPGIAICAAVLASAVAAAEIEVRFDRENIHVGESFTAVFETDLVIQDEPDFTPLYRDFDIINTQRSQTYRFFQGQRTRENRWVVTLVPKRAGILLIPSIHFGPDATRERAIQVLERQQVAAGGGEVFVEAAIEPNNPYVQAQSVLTVRLYRALRTSEASLSEPEAIAGEAVVKKLDDKRFNLKRDEVPYVVNELRYAVFPQTSGTVRLAPIEFRGQVGRRRQFVFDFNDLGLKPLGADGRALVRRSEAIELQVRPVPDAFPAARDWLPARKVQLSAAWAEEPPTFRVGEPATRILTLTAEGLSGEQLPALRWPLPGNFRSYPDRPEVTEQTAERVLIAQRKERVALIPDRPGPHVLPALEIPWWNTQANRLEKARLPEYRIEVLPPAQVAAGPAPLGGTAGLVAPVPAVAPAESEASLPSLLLPLLACGWGLTMLAWWWERRRRVPFTRRPVTSEPRTADLRQARARLRSACVENDPAAARRALLLWGRCLWPRRPPLSLAELQACEPALRKELVELNHALYRKGGGNWDGGPLWQLCEKRKPPPRTAVQAAASGGLEPLYPPSPRPDPAVPG